MLLLLLQAPGTPLSPLVTTNNAIKSSQWSVKETFTTSKKNFTASATACHLLAVEISDDDGTNLSATAVSAVAAAADHYNQSIIVGVGGGSSDIPR